MLCNLINRLAVLEVQPGQPKSCIQCFVLWNSLRPHGQLRYPEECNEHVPICESCGWEMGGALPRSMQGAPPQETLQLVPDNFKKTPTAQSL